MWYTVAMCAILENGQILNILLPDIASLRQKGDLLEELNGSPYWIVDDLR